MRTTTNNITKMLLVAFVIIALGSCRKESATVATEADAVDAIETSLVSSSGGTAEDISMAAEYAMSGGYGKNGSVTGATSLICAVPYDTTVSYSHTGTITATYSHSWEVLLNCNGSVPISLAWTGTYSGSFDALRLSGSSSGSRNWALTGINSGSAAYTLNGSTTRTGSHTSKVRNQYTYDVTINTTLTNLTVNKTTYQIISGTGTVAATLNVSNGTSKTFNGTIVFNGNQTATLTINGNTYTITVY